jgi:hypothetical protein
MSFGFKGLIMAAGKDFAVNENCIQIGNKIGQSIHE